MYFNEQNISHVDLYEKLFSLRQNHCSISHCYFKLKETFNELDKPHVLDLNVLQQYRGELTVAKFLSELDTSFDNQV